MSDLAEINLPPKEDRQVLIVLGKPKLYQLKALKATLHEIIKNTPGIILVLPSGEIPTFKLDIGETPCFEITPPRTARGAVRIIPTLRLCWRTSVQLTYDTPGYLNKIAALVVDSKTPWGKQSRKFLGRVPAMYLFAGRTLLNEIANLPAEGESNAA